MKERSETTRFRLRMAVVVFVAGIAVSGCSSASSPLPVAEDRATTTVAEDRATTTDTGSAPIETEVEAEVDEVTSGPIPTIDRSTRGVIEEVPCSDNSMCAMEFVLNGRTYAVSCALIDPAEVLDTELGTGFAFYREVRANALRVDPSHAMIALSITPESTGCSENPGPDAPTSPWQLASTGSSIADLSVLCDITLYTPEEAANHGCSP